MRVIALSNSAVAENEITNPSAIIAGRILPVWPTDAPSRIGSTGNVQGAAMVTTPASKARTRLSIFSVRRTIPRGLCGHEHAHRSSRRWGEALRRRRHVFVRFQTSSWRLVGPAMLSSIARSKATKQSGFPHSRRDGLLRGACHRARVRATRWLATTSPQKQSDPEGGIPAGSLEVLGRLEDWSARNLMLTL